MKKGIVSILLIGLLFSCDNNDSQDIQDTANKVVLLKIDFLTNEFEGGKEFNFSTSQSFTISSAYNAPGDFGDVQLYYQELNKKLFDGTIVWLGLGEMSYPETIGSPSTFSTIDNGLPLPDITVFKNVIYDEFAYYPEVINHSGIWNSINDLEIVSEYQRSNPNGQVHLFLYTPSVGDGNPADWDWFIILKN